MNHLISIEFLKFILNGGILGVLSIFIQRVIYFSLDQNLAFAYAIASALTYCVLVGINFLIQKKFIFEREGLFYKFVIYNICIMIFVSVLSELLLYIFVMIQHRDLGEGLSFILAALIGSYPSYLIKKTFVFSSGAK